MAVRVMVLGAHTTHCAAIRRLEAVGQQRDDRHSFLLVEHRPRRGRIGGAGSVLEVRMGGGFRDRGSGRGREGPGQREERGGQAFR